MSAPKYLVAKFESNGRYHPLICHMADVAAVTESLWDARLPGALRQSIAEELGTDEAVARRWLAFISGLHDIGKASRPFQARAKRDDLLAAAGLDAANVKDPGHGQVTTEKLPTLLEAAGMSRVLAANWATIVGGHHGRFLEAKPDLQRAICETDPAVRLAWEAARRELFEVLHGLVGLEVTPKGKPGSAIGMAIAGLVCVADWIASNTRYFDFEPAGTDDLAGYFQHARERARDALQSIHWSIPAPKPITPFEHLFGLGPPRPLQKAALAFRPADCAPGLVIIESVMGEGKTEAALLFAERWRDAGFAGLYFALPTQATANQLYERVASYLAQRFPDELVALSLAHGGARLGKDLAQLPELLPEHVGGDDGEQAGTVGAAEWFSTAKRSLLAPFGVGTIDQLLFAVLQVRHAFVRLFGLAGKVVVIDEVHAYDTYMTALLERLLEWLGALSAPVVLLSATLPLERRLALLEAYHRGASGGQGRVEIEGPVTYPSIVRLEHGRATATHVEVSPHSRRVVGIERIDESEQLGPLLKKLLESGGCAAVVCNTVGRAQEVYRKLEREFAGEIGLFHARFVAEDRRRIEEECLQRFGRSEHHPRPRFVLVATQVVEQSLDLDFDVMVTEIAPADLLLQRSGRMWRHERPGRQGKPTLQILWPLTSHGVPQFERGTKAVYDEHILLRTWIRLRETRTIMVPEDIPGIIEAVYTSTDEVPGAISGNAALDQYWRETWKQLKRQQATEQIEAAERRLKPPWNRGGVRHLMPDPREEDAPDLHPALQALTRLAEPSVDLVVLRPTDPAASATRPPDRDETQHLLMRSVRVSHRRLVRALADVPVPPPWRMNPALHRHRLLVVGQVPSQDVPGFAIQYGARLGLVIEDTR